MSRASGNKGTALDGKEEPLPRTPGPCGTAELSRFKPFPPGPSVGSEPPASFPLAASLDVFDPDVPDSAGSGITVACTTVIGTTGACRSSGSPAGVGATGRSRTGSPWLVPFFPVNCVVPLPGADASLTAAARLSPAAPGAPRPEAAAYASLKAGGGPAASMVGAAELSGSAVVADVKEIRTSFLTARCQPFRM